MARSKEKTRNNGTMTEAGYWGWIRSVLRKQSIYWKPILEAKKLSRRKSLSEGRNKFEYQCAHCKEWFPESGYEELEDGNKKKVKLIEVDHIIEAGSLTCEEDLPGFVERLFCEVDGFQVLCKTCHKVKTDNYKKK